MDNTVEFTVSAADSFSESLFVDREFNFGLISSTFVGVVTLQRKMTGTDVWRNVAVYTDSFEGWDTQPGGAHYRFGALAGEYTSGSMAGRLSNARI